MALLFDGFTKLSTFESEFDVVWRPEHVEIFAIQRICYKLYCEYVLQNQEVQYLAKYQTLNSTVTEIMPKVVKMSNILILLVS